MVGFASSCKRRDGRRRRLLRDCVRALKNATFAVVPLPLFFKLFLWSILFGKEWRTQTRQPRFLHLVSSTLREEPH